MTINYKMTTLALALGATAFASAPAMAVEVTYSGVVEAHFYLSDDGHEDDQHIEAGDVRFGIGLQDDSGAFASLRLDADGLSGDDIDADSVAVGYSGDWGAITLGETSTAHSMGQLANDMHGFNEDYEEHLAFTGSSGAVSYVLAYSPEGNTDVSGVGVQYSAGGLTLGAGFDTGVIGGDTDDSGAIVGVKYAFTNGSIAAHMGSRDSGDVTAVEGIITLGGWGVALTYSTLDGTGDITRLNFSKSLSDNLTWSLRAENTAPEEGDDVAFIRTSMTYSF